MSAYIVTKKTTNQNLIPRPRDVNVYLTGNQSKLGPQLMHHFIAPPPKRNASTREETLARTGRLASTLPLPSTIKSSAKGYSLSLTTCGPLRIRSCWHATSSSLMTLPSKSSTLTHPSCIVGNKNDWVSRMHPFAQSRKNDQVH